MSAVIEPRLVKVRAGSRGSGWAVGTRGVLTARHVVEPFLTGTFADGTTVDRCLAILDPALGAAVFDCDVIWQHQGLDLALLKVRDGCSEPWMLAMGQAKEAVLAEPGADTVPGKVVGYPALALDGTQPAPELVPGSLEPARAAVGGRMPFDVSSSVPEDSASWQGMSGAAFRDEHGRLRGVVVQVDKEHQQRRFFVAMLPDPAADAAFGQALTTVGAPATLEASDAPANRKLLVLLDPAGRAYPVAGVPDLAEFGVRRSRTDVDTHGDAYYPYVRRDLDRLLRDALDRRVRGTEHRALLLVGDAMAGKSRTLAESLRHHPVLAGRPLLVPHRDADLRQVVRCAADNGGVVWLDDANTYTIGLDAAVRALADTPGVIVAATLRTDQLLRLQDNPDLRATWDVLSADWLVEQLTVEPGWTESELGGLAGAESVIREAVRQGRPLGQVLGAAEELRKRLSLGSVQQKALVFTVSDWPRTGMPAALGEDLARRLWMAHLPASAAADLAEMADEDSERAYFDARAWASQKIAGTTSLVRRTRNGLVAEDYIVGLRVTADVTIPGAIWRQALGSALSSGSPADLQAIGYQAVMSLNYDIAGQALSPIAYGDSEVAAVAANALGLVLTQQGDASGAGAAFNRAIESGDPDVVPRAANSLGHLLKKYRLVEGALAAYRVAIESGHPEMAPRAAISAGDLLLEQGDVAGAKAAYRSVLDVGGPGAVPNAEKSLGNLLRKEGDAVGAMAAYQRAIDSADPEDALMTMISVGDLLLEQGDVTGARAVYDNVADSGSVNATAIARLSLGDLLRDQGDAAGAGAAYRQAIDSRNPVAAPRAAVSLGRLLAGQGDVAGATAAYQWAIDSREVDLAPSAAHNLGDLLLAQGDVAGATAAFQWAIDSGHPDQAPGAALSLGQLLAGRGDVAGATAAFQWAIGSGHPDAAPAAALGLGMLLDGHGDVAGATVAYQHAIDSRRSKLADLAPAAMVNLAAMLARQADVAGATAYYQQAIHSGNQEWAPAAAYGLAALFAKHGDVSNARASYQLAIDSPHPKWADMALVGLGILESGQGNADAAKALYQRAADSGHPDQAPIAMIELGHVLAGQGDAAGARAAYQRAIDSGHREQAPKAMVNLGLLLTGQGDVAGANAAYQQAIDSGNPVWASAAEIAIGDMLAEHGDGAGARSAYGHAIESGHADLAPMAMLQLGRLLAGQGDVAGAAAAYQQAIDSGHAEHAPAAMTGLGFLLATRQEAPDPETARRWYQRAAGAGNADAMMGLAPLLAAEGNADDAVALLRQAARAGNPRADQYAAVLDDDPADRERARAQLTELADGGDTDALNFLGVLAWRAARHDEALSLWTRSLDAHDGAAPLLLHLTVPAPRDRGDG